MPVTPSFVERVIGRLNILPSPLLDLQAAGIFRVVSFSIKLGVFETLNRVSLTAPEVSRIIGTDERSTVILLESLASFGYLKKRKGRYSNTSMTSKWLTRASPANILDFIVGWWDSLVFEFWDGHLEEAIRKGNPPLSMYDWLQRPGGWQAAQAAFASLAPGIGYRILGRVKLSGSARRLLDVGGGHGLYSIEFCRRYPNLSATVFDSPGALEVAKGNIAARGMSDRVSVQPGDFLKDDLGKGYDVALLANVVHGYSPENNVKVLRKIAAALNSGGLVVIWDQFAGKMRGLPALSAGTLFFSLTALVTQGGQNYPVGEVSRWLVASGFRKIRKPLGVPLIVATKPA